MSGGVDSSVAAALLKEAGFEVIGVMMNLLPERKEGGVASCCGAYAAEDARQVAHRLNIPFYLFNFEEEFEREVIDYFCREYVQGRTPNPCILCNERMKFDLLLKKVLQLGISYLATGHYVRNVLIEELKRFVLMKGVDPKKDQSYVLFSLTQDQLAHTLFPLGIFHKEEVRKKALHLGFRNHGKPDSQEICFIPEGNYHSFLREKMEMRISPGPILDPKGEIIGQHHGLSFYTIGQRKGLGSAMGKARYVTEIDPVRNAIIVGGRQDLLCKTFQVNHVNWIVPQRAEREFLASVKIRYQHPGSPARIYAEENQNAKVEFLTPQASITPGQAAVFYDKDILLGGGWVEKALA
jgi:tRNA-uridine 2-sulfurtransferase